MKAIRVILIDRTRARAARLAEALESLGDVAWEWIGNTDDAVDHLASSPADAVLADWDVVGGADGVRDVGFRPGTPLIVVSSRITQEEVVACLKAGAADCVRRTNRTRVRAALAEAIELAEFEKDGPVDEARYRELIRDLARAERARADFVGNLSHELRTPLNVIIGYSDMLLDEAFGSVAPEPGQAIGKIRRQARELLDLVNTTLELSRVEAGRIPLEVEPVDVSALIGEIEDETSVLIDGKDVRVERHVPDDLSKPTTDPVKLRVILKNLVTNAMKFTDHGLVRISGRDRDGGIELAVTDTGPGIPIDQRHAIFEAFQQGDTARGRRGAGLGLHIVTRLLAVLDGTITLESEVGKGSEFRVWIPLARSQVDPHHRAIASSRPRTAP
jgi:signal transduction histidine kinase